MIRRVVGGLRNTSRGRSLIARVALLLVAFIVPLFGAAAILVSQQNAKIALTALERDGLEFTKLNIVVVRNLRALRDRVEIDGTSGQAERIEVARSLGALYDYNALGGRDLGLTKRLKRLELDWAATNTNNRSGVALNDAFADAVQLFYFITDRSTLSADTDISTAALIDAFGAQLPTIGERADTAKLVLIRALKVKRDVLQERIAAAVLEGQARYAYDMASSDVSNAAKIDVGVVSSIQPHIRTIGSALADFVDVANQNTPRATASRNTLVAVRDSGDRVANAVFDGYQSIARQIDRSLTNRANSERRGLLLIYIEALLALLAGAIIAIQIARTIRDRDRAELERTRNHAERLAAELAHQKALEALSLSEAQLRAVFDRSTIGVAILDREGKIIRTNQALREMIDPIEPAHVGAADLNFARLLAGDIESFTTELEMASTQGDVVWFEATLSVVGDDAGRPLFAVSMLKDVTERRSIAERLRHEATHDSLSGLPNRAYFFEQMRSRFFSESRAHGVNAVLFVDLDEFKFVNDSLGHAVGDDVLVAIATRLRKVTRAGDVVARFGGDEFAILLAGRADSLELERVVERLGRVLAQPLMVDGREIFMTASIGVATVHDGYISPEAIVRDADTAMYYAKAAGRSRFSFFNPAMHEQASRRLAIATQLRRALDRGEFSPAFQPVVSLTTGRLTAVEALLRWENPDLGSVSPAEFIAIAEEIGLIVPIGRYILEGACAQLAAWKRDPVFDRPLRMSINASVREILQTGYPDFLAKVVTRHGLMPSDITLEVTESAILASGKFSSRALERLKALGVGLAIDDFGTGYSSLRYLQQYPFDELKIDGSFISGSGDGLASEAIVGMLLALGKSFAVSVVAEGVETPEQAERLRALGCASAQGYHFGAPGAAAMIEQMMRREKSLAN